MWARDALLRLSNTRGDIVTGFFQDDPQFCFCTQCSTLLFFNCPQRRLFTYDIPIIRQDDAVHEIAQFDRGCLPAHLLPRGSRALKLLPLGQTDLAVVFEVDGQIDVLEIAKWRRNWLSTRVADDASFRAACTVIRTGFSGQHPGFTIAACESGNYLAVEQTEGSWQLVMWRHGTKLCSLLPAGIKTPIGLCCNPVGSGYLVSYVNPGFNGGTACSTIADVEICCGFLDQSAWQLSENTAGGQPSLPRGSSRVLIPDGQGGLLLGSSRTGGRWKHVSRESGDEPAWDLTDIGIAKGCVFPTAAGVLQWDHPSITGSSGQVESWYLFQPAGSRREAIITAAPAHGNTRSPDNRCHARPPPAPLAPRGVTPTRDQPTLADQLAALARSQVPAEPASPIPHQPTPAGQLTRCQVNWSGAAAASRQLQVQIASSSGNLPQSSGNLPQSRPSALAAVGALIGAAQSVNKLVPLFGDQIAGMLEIVQEIIIMRDSVKFNKAKAASLDIRAEMAAQALKAMISDATSQVLFRLQRENPHQLEPLGLAIRNLDKALVAGKQLAMKWNQGGGLNTIVRSIKHKLDAEEILRVSNGITTASTDLTFQLSSIGVQMQIILHNEVLMEIGGTRQQLEQQLTSFLEQLQKELVAANRFDMSSLQADLIVVAGGVDELKIMLAEDSQLQQEWRDYVKPVLQSIDQDMKRSGRQMREMLYGLDDVKQGVDQRQGHFDYLKQYLHNLPNLVQQLQPSSASNPSSSSNNGQGSGTASKDESRPGTSHDRSSSTGRDSNAAPNLIIAAAAVTDVLPLNNAQGMFAQVYKGCWMGQDVAVKKLHIQGVNQEEVDTIYKEALTIIQLRHPCIIQCYGLILEETPDIGSNSLHGSLVMELGEQSLQGLLDSSANKQLPLKTRLDIAVAIASGVAYLHGISYQVVHGDLKPGNVLVTTRRNGSYQVKICDFGLSETIAIDKRRGCNSFMATPGISKSSSIGTVRYLAPECCKVARKGGNPTVEPARDIYAFGLVLYQLVTGLRPFDEPEYRNSNDLALLKHISKGVVPSLDRCHWVYSDDGPVVQQLVGLLQQCWRTEPQDRPVAGKVLEELLELRCQLA